MKSIPASSSFFKSQIFIISLTIGLFSSQTVIAQPANDDCANAINLTVGTSADCPSNTVTTDAISATQTPDELVSCDGVNNRGVWYTFTAPAAGGVVINYTGLTGSNLPGVALFDMCGGSEIPGTCQDPNSSGLIPITGLMPGTMYTMLLWFNGPAGSQNFDICLSTTPANDDCADAINLTVGTLADCASNTVTTDAKGASATPDEIVSCDNFDNKGVWYTFTAPAAEVTINYTAGTATANPGVALFDQCVGSEITGTCQNNPFAGLADFTGLTPGTMYTMLLWFDDNSSAGTFDICLSTLPPPPPPNDFCSGAIPETFINPPGTGCTIPTVLPFTTDGTTDSGQDGSCIGSDSGLDQFFTWTATDSLLVWDNQSTGNPGIVIWDATCTTEIDCRTPNSDGILSGWAVGDNLVIQIYDFENSFSDVAFCLETGGVLNCATNEAATAHPSCGNIDVFLTWDATTIVTGYKITIGTTPGGVDVEDNTDLSNSTTYRLVAPTPSTTYFWTVTPYRDAQDAMGCSEFSFTTAAASCNIISETAGATTTVTVAGGEIFADPNDGTTGGLGGDCSNTNNNNSIPGNYPNCNCVTLTTLAAPAGQQVSVTFTQFRVFGAFDWLAIFDGSAAVTATNTSGSATNPTSSDPLLWNSTVDGDELSDMFAVGSITFTSTNGSLTFASRFSGVVSTCGWEANVIACDNGDCPQPELFVTTWEVAANDVITIPLQSGTYDFDYKWTLLSNPTVEITGTHTNADGDFTTNFVDAGNYQLEITGVFPHLRGYPVAKLLDVTQWGQIVWRSMFESFKDWEGVSFSALDIPNLSQVTSMNSTFRSASNFDSDIGNWNVSNINNMFRLFQGATNFNQDISSWDVDEVANMNAMFENAERFNQNISGWNVGKVTAMNFIFTNADDFNQPIGTWDVSNVTTMRSMFNSADSFNQDISDWEVSKVTNVRDMFSNADSFNQPIGTWDVSEVTEFRDMFNGNNAFNQSLGNWKLNPNASFQSTFTDATAFDCQTWSSTILGWHFSNPDLENIPVGGPNADYDLTATRARDKLVARGWSINGTAFNGDCGAVHEFACSDTLELSQDTLFGELIITAEVIILDSIVIDTVSNVDCTAGESIVLGVGFETILGSEFIAQIDDVDCTITSNSTALSRLPSNNDMASIEETRQEELYRHESNSINGTADSPPFLERELSFQVFHDPSDYEIQLHFYLPEDQEVSIQLIDQMGRPIQTILPTQQRAAGDHRIGFTYNSGLDGLFNVVIQTTQKQMVEKMVVVDLTNTQQDDNTNTAKK